jgi:hypothetical protein
MSSRIFLTWPREHNQARPARGRAEQARRSKPGGVAPRFHELVFTDARAIREVVNSGERSLHDALKLAREARKFRGWNANQPADADLLHEVYRACVARSWAVALRAKALRWLVVTGGVRPPEFAVAPPVGAVIGPGYRDSRRAARRHVGGWRPHQFVEKKLRSFVESEQVWTDAKD